MLFCARKSKIISLIVFIVFHMIIAPLAAQSGSHANLTVIRIRNQEMAELVSGTHPEFPKYTTQIINLANQNAQATRPRVVGQMSELVQAFPGKGYDQWVTWYLAAHPEAIDTATRKTYQMVQNLKKAILRIDEAMVRQWIEDLVLTKTYVGLHVQESILRKVAAMKQTTWRLANPGEEAKGIDGYIGEQPVSIKPDTYRQMDRLDEDIRVPVIYYRKIKGGIRVILEF